MPVLFGFKQLAALPKERITDKISRKVLSGKQSMMVWWKIKAGAHAAAHKHPHEQIVWMLKGKMDNTRRLILSVMRSSGSAASCLKPNRTGMRPPFSRA